MSTFNNPLIGQDEIQSVAFKSGESGGFDFTNFDSTKLDLNTDMSYGGLFDKNSITQKLNNTTPPNKSSFGDMFSGGNLGSTMQGIGVGFNALASIYGQYEQKKFNKEMLDMEKKRVAKENTIRDDAQAQYDKVWKS